MSFVNSITKPYYKDDGSLNKNKIFSDFLYLFFLTFIAFKLYGAGFHNGSLFMCEEMNGTYAMQKGDDALKCYQNAYLDSLGFFNEETLETGGIYIDINQYNKTTES